MTRRLYFLSIGIGADMVFGGHWLAETPEEARALATASFLTPLDPTAFEGLSPSIAESLRRAEEGSEQMRGLYRAGMGWIKCTASKASHSQAMNP